MQIENLIWVEIGKMIWKILITNVIIPVVLYKN